MCSHVARQSEPQQPALAALAWMAEPALGGALAQAFSRLFLSVAKTGLKPVRCKQAGCRQSLEDSLQAWRQAELSQTCMHASDSASLGTLRGTLSRKTRSACSASCYTSRVKFFEDIAESHERISQKSLGRFKEGLLGHCWNHVGKVPAVQPDHFESAVKDPYCLRSIYPHIGLPCGRTACEYDCSRTKRIEMTQEWTK